MEAWNKTFRGRGRPTPVSGTWCLEHWRLNCEGAQGQDGSPEGDKEQGGCVGARVEDWEGNLRRGCSRTGERGAES